MVDSVQVTESGQSAQFLFFLEPPVDHYRIAEVKAPPGISVAFSAERRDEPEIPDGDRDLISGMINPDEFRIRTIVIDPGHGGKDPGAIGWHKTKEKDINLAEALKVAKLLRKKTGLNIILTRRKDTYISLSDRTKMANSRKADLVVIIHCNAPRKQELRGVGA